MADKLDGRFLGSIWQNEKHIDRVLSQYHERGWLFFVFSYASIGVIGIVMAMMWFLLEPGLFRLHPFLPVLIFIVLLGIGMVLLVDITLMTLSVLTQRNFIPYYHATKRYKYLMPLIMRLGMVLGIVPDRMISSYLRVNNTLAHILNRRKKKDNILVLLPRCLQHFKCQQPVVSDINACRSCGKCDIVKLVKLNKDYNLVMAVATGGGLAKSLIRDLKPHGVIAVACERELMEGLRDTQKIPIIAIANTRPEGPCKNTRVDTDAIEKAIKLFRNI